MNMTLPFSDHEGHASSPRSNPLEHRATVDPRLGDLQSAHVSGLFCRIGLSTEDNLFEQPGTTIGKVSQRIQSILDTLIADQVGQWAYLGCRDSGVSVSCLDEGHCGHSFEWFLPDRFVF